MCCDNIYINDDIFYNIEIIIIPNILNRQQIQRILFKSCPDLSYTRRIKRKNCDTQYIFAFPLDGLQSFVHQKIQKFLN